MTQRLPYMGMGESPCAACRVPGTKPCTVCAIYDIMFCQQFHIAPMHSSSYALSVIVRSYT